ncbi:MAG: SGNH/GDSL hydrolase family protein [Eubacteriales bacterium]|nr:SGNH/GDSL hydrolase family protein [Eubacteriales bacterium]
MAAKLILNEEKPLLVLGDSISKGIILDSVTGRYCQLEDSFAARLSKHYQIKVHNLSVFGATIVKGLKQVKRHARLLSEGGIALIQFGGNDCDFMWSDISSCPEGEHLPQVGLNDFVTQYEQLIDILQQRDYQPVLMNLPPLIHERYFASLSRGLDAAVILDWLGGTTETIYLWHKSYSDAVEKIACKNGLPLIDLRTAFLKNAETGEYMCEDGIHPNAGGHKLIFDVLTSNIE